MRGGGAMETTAVSAISGYAQWRTSAVPPQGAERGDARNVVRGSQGREVSVTRGEATGLTEEERREVQSLAQRDREVRAHEQAHIAAGGAYVRGGANFTYERGPDGKLYAVGGEVSIDTSPVPNNPAATIQKMEIVKQAALAPSQPSPQDYRVAAAAQMAIANARAELAKMKAQEAYQGIRRNTFAGEGGSLSLIV